MTIVRRAAGTRWAMGLSTGIAAFLVAGAVAAQGAPAAIRLAQAAGPGALADSETARAAFSTLSERERRAIQDALLWTGHYAGTVDGAFGPRTLAAIQSYQRTARLPQSGLLSRDDITALLAEGDRFKNAAGFQVIDEPRAGVQIGVPLAFLSKTTEAPGATGGRRWQSPDERVTLDTRHYPPGEITLQAIFDRLTAPNSGRQITYRLLRDRFLVVSGETAGGKFYIRYDASEAGVRGFSIGYDKALAEPFDKLSLAIANSFNPFPDSSAAVAAMAGSIATDDSPYATGVFIGPGIVATAADLETCAAITVAGAPATILARLEGGIVLLTTEARGQPLHLANGSGAAEVMVLARQTLSGSPVLAAIPARLDGASLHGALQQGAAGAPLVDSHGDVVGIVTGLRLPRPVFGGLRPPATHDAVRLETSGVHRFLPGGVEQGKSLAASEDLENSVPSITCRN